MRFIKRVTDRGSVTLPSDVRDALGVGEGDIVEFEIVAVVRRADGPPLRGRPVADTAAQEDRQSDADGASKDASRASPS